MTADHRVEDKLDKLLTEDESTQLTMHLTIIAFKAANMVKHRYRVHVWNLMLFSTQIEARASVLEVKTHTSEQNICSVSTLLASTL
jgi:predicted nucleic acid-binding protein